MADGIVPFSLRQLPSTLLTVGTVAGPTAWRFDAGFIEAADSSRKMFTLSEAFTDGKLLVFANGVKQTSAQVTLHAPTVVEFASAPATGSILECWYLIPASAEQTQWTVNETMGGTKNGSNKTFTTFYPFVSTKIMVFRNGLKLIRGATNDYTELSPTSIEINAAPTSTEAIEAVYFIQV
jgi:hypothetical protein